MSEKPEEMTAVFEQEMYRKPDTDWCIILVETGDEITGTVKAGELVQGVTYRFFGIWKETTRYGRQFQFRSFIQATPHSRRGVVAYLDKFAPHIGIRTANRLCDLYGANECIGVLKSDPERVANDTKLTIQQARIAANALADIEGVQETKIELMDLFYKRGFSSKCIDLAIKLFGVLAPTKIKNDPWCMLVHHFPLAGFSRVDKLYQDLGHPSDRLKRQVYCAVHTVENDESGSTWVPFSLIERRIEYLVTGTLKPEKAVRIAVKCGLLLREDREGVGWFALRRLGQAEIDSAQSVRELLGEEWFQSQDIWKSEVRQPDCEDTSTGHHCQELQTTNSTQSSEHLAEDWDF